MGKHIFGGLCALQHNDKMLTIYRLPSTDGNAANYTWLGSGRNTEILNVDKIGETGKVRGTTGRRHTVEGRHIDLTQGFANSIHFP